MKAKDIEIAEVPKNMTYLLQPLDLTVNKSLKQLEIREFSKYYSDSIARFMRENPISEIENAQVDVIYCRP